MLQRASSRGRAKLIVLACLGLVLALVLLLVVPRLRNDPVFDRPDFDYSNEAKYFPIDFAARERGPAAAMTANVDELLEPFFRRVRLVWPWVDVDRIVSKKVDVVLSWKTYFHKNSDAKISGEERAVFLNYTLPNLLRCSFCQVHIDTALADDMFDEELLAIMRRSNLHVSFHNSDLIAKLLQLKFTRHRELLTVVLDLGAIVEHDYFYKLLRHVDERKLKADDRLQICFRPKTFYEVQRSEKALVWRLPEPPRGPRVAYAMYTRGAYNDPISIDANKFLKNDIKNCNVVPIDSTGFVVTETTSATAPENAELWSSQQERFALTVF